MFLFMSEILLAHPDVSTTLGSKEDVLVAQTGSQQQEKVIVNGKRSKNRADRTVYDAKSDPENSTLSLGEVLNKAPGVSVDTEGNLSLRGDKNVKLLINGRETLATNIENRAMFLLSLGGQSIDSIEVMTNPSAQFTSDGAAGVINIVTKNNADLGVTFVARVRVDSSGGQGLSLNVSENKGKIDKGMSLEVRKSVSDSELDLMRTIKNNKGNLTGFMSNIGQSVGNSVALNFTATYGYKLSEIDRLNLELSYKFRNTDLENQTSGANSNSSNISLYTFDRTSNNSVDVQDGSVDLSWSRNYLNGNKLIVSLNYSDFIENLNGFNNSLYLYTSGSFSNFSDFIDRHNSYDKKSIKLDYSTQLFGNTANLGFETTQEDGKRQALYSNLVAGSIIKNDRLSNEFEYRNFNDALYAAINVPILEHLSTQVGLRYERWGNKIPIEATSNIFKSDEFHLYGSLHISYFFDDDGILRASYSMRTQRPEIKDLNPFLVYRDKENWSSGNPYLISAEGDIFEIGYDKSSKGKDFSIKLYRKSFDNLVSTSYEWLDNEVLLSTKTNGGKIVNSGIDLDFSGPITKSIRANVNLGYGVIKVATSDFISDDYTGIYSGKISLTYRISSKDNVTFFISSTGKQVSIDETKKSGLISSLSYNHKFANNASATFSYQNLLNDNNYNSVRSSLLSDDKFKWKSNISYIGVSITYKLQSNKI